MMDVLTINGAVDRARSEGLDVSYHAVSRWIKSGALPCRYAGKKALIYYPRLLDFLACADGQDNPAAGAKG